MTGSRRNVWQITGRQYLFDRRLCPAPAPASAGQPPSPVSEVSSVPCPCR